MLRVAAIALAVSCMAVAPARTAETDRSPDAAAPDDEVTTPGGAPPSSGEQERPPRPRIDPVEERIKYLHSRLRITAAQEPLWSDVARVLRENAKAVGPVLKERLQTTEHGSALDTLGSYEKLGEVQLDGLKHFIAAFHALYEKLSPEQKKIADTIFRIGPLAMIGGIPQLPEALMAVPLPPSIAALGYPPYPVAPFYPPYPPGYAYSVPPVYVYRGYPVSPAYLYHPPYVVSPFYYNRPWVGFPPAEVLIGRGILLHQHGAEMHH